MQLQHQDRGSLHCEALVVLLWGSSLGVFMLFKLCLIFCVFVRHPEGKQLDLIPNRKWIWWSDLRRVLRREVLLFTSELLLVLPLLQHHAKNAGVHLLGCNIRAKEKERKRNKLLVGHGRNVCTGVKHLQQLHIREAS